MKLFIIGNGFDKGHNLNTSYWDFRIFLQRCYPDFLYCFESKYDIYPGYSDYEKQELLWNEFEKNLANIDEDIIIENAVSIDMGLECGDIGIEDTLYDYFSEELEYIDKLSYYLKLWIQSIRIRDVQPRTNIINSKNNDLYINFNYTGVLQNTYKIDKKNVIHIHGSLRKYDDELIIGHGNYKRIKCIRDQIITAEEFFDEKEISICKAVEDYYIKTYKDTNQYKYKLLNLIDRTIDEIIIIGHSVSDVDTPYFKAINAFLGQKVKWIVYYFDKNQKKNIYTNLIKCNIKKRQITMKACIEFYNIN